MANKWPFVKRRHRVVPPVGPFQLLLLLLLMQCAPSVLSTLFHCINGTQTSLVTSTRRRNSFCRFHKLKRICINPNQQGNWFFSPFSSFFFSSKFEFQAIWLMIQGPNDGPSRHFVRSKTKGSGSLLIDAFLPSDFLYIIIWYFNEETGRRQRISERRRKKMKFGLKIALMNWSQKRDCKDYLSRVLFGSVFCWLFSWKKNPKKERKERKKHVGGREINDRHHGAAPTHVHLWSPVIDLWRCRRRRSI